MTQIRIKDVVLDAATAYVCGQMFSTLMRIPFPSHQVGTAWASYICFIEINARSIEDLTNYTLSQLPGNTINNTLITKLFSLSVVAAVVHQTMEVVYPEAHEIVNTLWPTKLLLMTLGTGWIFNMLDE